MRMDLNKEAIGAIIIGFGLGFILAASIFLLPNLLKKKESTSLPAALEAGKTFPSPREPLLTLNIPEDFYQTDKEVIKVSGRTKPGSLIVINSVDHDYIINVDPSGNFDQEIDVAYATQEIFFSAYFSSLEKETVKRTIIRLPKDGDL